MAINFFAKNITLEEIIIKCQRYVDLEVVSNLNYNPKSHFTKFSVLIGDSRW